MSAVTPAHGRHPTPFVHPTVHGPDPFARSSNQATSSGVAVLEDHSVLEKKICGIAESVLKDLQFALDYLAALSICAVIVQSFMPIGSLVMVVIAAISHFFSYFSDQNTPTVPSEPVSDTESPDELP